VDIDFKVICAVHIQDIVRWLNKISLEVVAVTTNSTVTSKMSREFAVPSPSSSSAPEVQRSATAAEDGAVPRHNTTEGMVDGDAVSTVDV